MRYLSVSDADGRRRLVAEVDGQLLRVEGFADVGELLASGASAATGEPLDRSTLTIRSPLARPGKIICIGLNYRDHCREQNIEPPRYPMLFAKFGNAVNDPGGSVLRPRATEKLDLECELGVVIGRSASRIGPAEALDHVFGYTVVNDITMRDLQAEDRQWLRAKGADGFAPIGPAVVSRDEIGDPQALAMRSSVNGETWQESSTAEMVFDVATLVAFVSTVIRLEPGDLIATGTPAGVGHYQRPPRYLADGDLLRCEIEGIGAIDTTVIDEVPRIADHGNAAGIEALEGARR
jgi:2-keto-4-pentenoate hydratase/2-oxohepta-3-ene-1,7-dioic acid hydratase in catechol pathway